MRECYKIVAVTPIGTWNNMTKWPAALGYAINSHTWLHSVGRLEVVRQMQSLLTLVSVVDLMKIQDASIFGTFSFGIMLRHL